MERSETVRAKNVLCKVIKMTLTFDLRVKVLPDQKAL